MLFDGPVVMATTTVASLAFFAGRHFILSCCVCVVLCCVVLCVRACQKKSGVVIHILEYLCVESHGCKLAQFVRVSRVGYQNRCSLR